MTVQASTRIPWWERALLWIERYPLRSLFRDRPLDRPIQSRLSGAPIVCGDCVGDEEGSSARFTEMTTVHGCAGCGGESFVNAGKYLTQVAIARAVDEAMACTDGRLVSSAELDAIDRVIIAAREAVDAPSQPSRRRLAWALEELDRLEQTDNVTHLEDADYLEQPV